MNLRETIHCQGWSERESRHSVGQLEAVCSKEIDAKKKNMYRVQVPAARGRVIPDMDSMSEDFPALWTYDSNLRKINVDLHTALNDEQESVG